MKYRIGKWRTFRVMGDITDAGRGRGAPTGPGFESTFIAHDVRAQRPVAHKATKAREAALFVLLATGSKAVSR